MDGLLTTLLSAAIAGAISGVCAYVAIRVEIAVVKHRMERADEDRRDMKVDISDAHERIDSLTRSRMETL